MDMVVMQKVSVILYNKFIDTKDPATLVSPSTSNARRLACRLGARVLGYELSFCRLDFGVLNQTTAAPIQSEVKVHITATRHVLEPFRGLTVADFL
jgi:hypothetical protein